MVSAVEEFEYRYGETAITYYDKEGRPLPFSVAGVARKDTMRETEKAFKNGDVSIAGSVLYPSADRWRTATVPWDKLDLTLPNLGVLNIGSRIVAASYLPARTHKRGFRSKNVIQLNVGGGRNAHSPRSAEFLRSVFNPQYPEIAEIFRGIRTGDYRTQAFNPRMWIGQPLMKGGEFPVFGYDYMIVGYVEDEQVVHLLPQYSNLLEEISEWFPVVLQEDDVFVKWMAEAVENSKTSTNKDKVIPEYDPNYLEAVQNGFNGASREFWEVGRPRSRPGEWGEDPEGAAEDVAPTRFEWGMFEILAERANIDWMIPRCVMPPYPVICSMLHPDFFHQYRPRFFLEEQGATMGVLIDDHEALQTWMRDNNLVHHDCRPEFGNGYGDILQPERQEEGHIEAPDLQEFINRVRGGHGVGPRGWRVREEPLFVDDVEEDEGENDG